MLLNAVNAVELLLNLPVRRYLLLLFLCILFPLLYSNFFMVWRFFHNFICLFYEVFILAQLSLLKLLLLSVIHADKMIVRIIRLDQIRLKLRLRLGSQSKSWFPLPPLRLGIQNTYFCSRFNLVTFNTAGLGLVTSLNLLRFFKAFILVFDLL